MGHELNDAVIMANQQMEAWASECDKTIACSSIEKYIEVEMSVITQRYDRFGRLVSETIENLRIKLRDTRSKEVSNEHKSIRVCNATWKIKHFAYFPLGGSIWCFFSIFCMSFLPCVLPEPVSDTWSARVRNLARNRLRLRAGMRNIPYTCMSHAACPPDFLLFCARERSDSVKKTER